MLLQNEALRVALVTTHLPLAEVPHAITAERLRATLRSCTTDLERHFCVAAPRIAVLGPQSACGRVGTLWAARKST